MRKPETRARAWPALMTDTIAARYTSLDKATFRRFALALEIAPVEPCSGKVRWRKSDIDAQLRKVSTISQRAWPGPQGQVAPNLTSINRTAANFAQRNGLKRKAEGLFSVTEATAILSVGRSTLYNMMSAGTLVPTRIGHRVLFSRSELDRIAGSGGRTTVDGSGAD